LLIYIPSVSVSAYCRIFAEDVYNLIQQFMEV